LYNPEYVKRLRGELQVAAGFIDDLQAFLAKALQWIIDNWETVLKVALSLLFLVI